jgi:hypothetical protein
MRSGSRLRAVLSALSYSPLNVFARLPLEQTCVGSTRAKPPNQRRLSQVNESPVEAYRVMH